MENVGVKCCVSECMHFKNGDKCGLSMINITNERNSPADMATPHFCKSFTKRG